MLSFEKQCRVIAAVTEGCSIRPTARLVDVGILGLLGVSHHDIQTHGIRFHRSPPSHSASTHRAPAKAPRSVCVA